MSCQQFKIWCTNPNFPNLLGLHFIYLRCQYQSSSCFTCPPSFCISFFCPSYSRVLILTNRLYVLFHPFTTSHSSNTDLGYVVVFLNQFSVLDDIRAVLAYTPYFQPLLFEPDLNISFMLFHRFCYYWFYQHFTYLVFLTKIRIFLFVYFLPTPFKLRADYGLRAMPLFCVQSFPGSQFCPYFRILSYHAFIFMVSIPLLLPPQHINLFQEFSRTSARTGESN